MGKPGFYRSCWYRRAFEAPELAHGERLVLRFGAVDHEPTVWVDGRLAATHSGGYTPFHVDVAGRRLARAARLAAERGFLLPERLPRRLAAEEEGQTASGRE